MATTLTEADERKLVKKYGLTPCPTMGAAGIHTRAVVAIDASTGKRRLVRQCPDCGWVWPASGSIGDYPAAPAVNPTAASLRAAEVQAATDRRNATIRERFAIRKAAKPTADAAWFAWYNEYLRTPSWRIRRDAVLIRDNSRCQLYLDGCERHATEVHHLAYDQMREGDFTAHQPLYDLVAVCHACHVRQTEYERSQRKK